MSHLCLGVFGVAFVDSEDDGERLGSIASHPTFEREVSNVGGAVEGITQLDPPHQGMFAAGRLHRYRRDKNKYKKKHCQGWDKFRGGEY
ncbi:hypothetical protein TNCV_2533071 [Trichonephila clavipes]|nr:hypothetical protein TNCV_2533071 [Trichonephila clavipes]